MSDASPAAASLIDAVAVLDAFHVVKLATQVVDEVRPRVQQDTCGHRGHRNDPLYRARNILRAGDERLTDRQPRPPHRRVHLPGGAPRGRARLAVRPTGPRPYHQDAPAAGKAIAEKILA